jgi:Transcriptional regulators
MSGVDDKQPGPTRGFHAIERTDLFREVFDQIEGYILKQGLQDGDRLPSDRRLATELGVSRPLVRQVLKVLEGLGRITAHQGVGTFVSGENHRVAVNEMLLGLTIDNALVRDLLPARAALEIEILKAAFDARSPARIAELGDALAEQAKQLSAADTLEVRLDLAFEAAMGRICGNEILRRLQALLHEMWLTVHIDLHSTREAKAVFHAEHELIFQAYQANDREAALKVMTAHMSALEH